MSVWIGRDRPGWAVCFVSSARYAIYSFTCAARPPGPSSATHGYLRHLCAFADIRKLINESAATRKKISVEIAAARPKSEPESLNAMR